MIKLMGMLTRKDGLTPEAFQSHWRDVRAPMIARAPGLRSYIQSHTIQGIVGGEPQAYDGIAEAWFDSFEALDTAIASDGWQEAIRDAPNFIGGGANMFVTEVPIIDALASPRERESMVKYVGFLTRKPNHSVEQFQRHWRDVHAPLVVAQYPDMRRYIQAHAIPETYGTKRQPAFDGAPQAWFDNLEIFLETLGRPHLDPPVDAAALDAASVFVLPIPTVAVHEIVIVG